MALGGKVHAWLKSLYSTAPMFELINGSLNRWGPNIFLDSQTFRRCLICMNKISPSTFKSLFLKFTEMPNTKSHGAWSLRLKNAGMKRLEVNHWHMHSLIDKASTHIYFYWGQWHAHISLCRHADPLKETWSTFDTSNSSRPCLIMLAVQGRSFILRSWKWVTRSGSRCINTGRCGTVHTGKEEYLRKARNIMRKQIVASSNHPMLPGFRPHQ